MRLPKSNLVLIEGAPGLGKTTTITNLQRRLCNSPGVRGVFCHERDHPLHAFWTWGDGHLQPDKIDEPFSTDKFIVRLMTRTYAFVDQLLTKNQTAFIETYPFQSPVRNILKMLGTEADCTAYFRRFADAVEPVLPLLVYFDHPNWKDRIYKVAEERGESFNSVFFDAFYRSPFGMKYRITTPDGVVGFYELYLEVCETLIRAWPFRILRFNPIAEGETATINRILHETGITSQSL